MLLHALNVFMHRLIDSEFELFVVCNRMILARDSHCKGHWLALCDERRTFIDNLQISTNCVLAEIGCSKLLKRLNECFLAAETIDIQTT